MKKIIIFMLITMVVVSIAAIGISCKEEGVAPVEEAEETTEPVQEEEVAEEAVEEEAEEELLILDVWHMWHDPSTNAVYDELVAEFMDDNPNVIVDSNVITVEESTKVLKMAITTGTGPDVLHQGVSIPEQEAYVSEGFLISLKDIAEQYKWYDRMGKTYIEYYNEKYLPELYYIALDLEVIGVYYNKEIFSDLGLTLPTTWAEFENIIDTVSEAGYQPFALGNLDMWPGSQILDTLTLGKVSMDRIHEIRVLGEEGYKDEDEAFLEAAKLAQEWGTKGYYGKDFNAISYDDSFNQMYSEKAAMFIMGSWALTSLDEDAPFDYGFFLMPPSDPNVPIAAYGGMGNSYFISSQVEETGKTEIAAKFVDFMLSEHAAEKFFEAGRIVGIDIDTAGLKFRKGQDEIMEAVKILGESQGGIAGWYTTYWPGSWEFVNPRVQQLLTGQITPEDYMQQIRDGYLESIKSKTE